MVRFIPLSFNVILRPLGPYTLIQTPQTQLVFVDPGTRE